MELEPTGDGSISVDLTNEELEGLKTNTSDVIDQLQNENQTATEEVVSDEQTTEPSTEASKDKNPTFAESYNEQSGDFDVSNPVKALENAPNYPAAMGHGFVNAGIDIVNLAIPDKYDIPRLPEYESKVGQALSDISGIVIPSLGLRGALVKRGAQVHAAGQAAPWLQRLGNKASFAWFAKFGADVGTGALVDWAVKQNQRDDNATGMLKKFWPRTYQWIPNSVATNDKDTPDQKRSKNLNEGAIFNVFSSIIEGSAYLLKAQKSLTRTTKFVASEPSAQKKLDLLTKDKFTDVKFSDNPIEDSVLRNEARKQDDLDKLGMYFKSKNDQLKTEAKELIDQPLEDIPDDQLLDLVKRAAEENPDKISPENLARLNKNLEEAGQPLLGVDDTFSQNETLIRTKDPDGVLGAAVDAARIANNIDSTYGRLGSVVTDAFLKFGLETKNKTERVLIKSLAEEIKNGGKYSKELASGKKVTEAEIESAGNALVEILADPRMQPGDMMKVLDEFKQTIEGSSIKMVGKKGMRGVNKALKVLKDEIFDLDSQKARAYLVTSLGGQVADIAEGVRLMDDAVVQQRAIEQIADRLEYLMVEKGLAGYEWGSYGKALSEFNKEGRKNAGALKEMAATAGDDLKAKLEFDLIPSAKNYSNTLKEVAANNPGFLKAFQLANELTDGDVDGLYKLNTFVKNKLHIFKKAIIDTNPETPSIINRAFLSNIYNSVLSSVATPLKAAVGNFGGLTARPIAQIVGATINRDWHTLNKARWSHFSLDDTLQRSLNHMTLVFKKASTDPYKVSYVMRDDIAVMNEESLAVLKEYGRAAAEKGEDGVNALLHVYEDLEALSVDPALRLGANSMTALDGFSRSVTANAEAKARAFDELTSQGVEITPERLREVSEKIYKQMFDKNGMINDEAVEYINSEIALNLDSPLVDGLNNLLDRYPVVKPHFLFPRTSANIIQTFGRYSPMGVFSQEYQKLFGFNGMRTIDSFSPTEIKEILDSRKIPFDNNFMNSFKAVRAEVRGKVAIGTIFTSAVLARVRSGGLRGNGHFDKSRQKVRRAVGWKRKTFQGLDGGWYDYEWMGPLGDWMSTIVDVSDHMDLLSSTQQEHFFSKLAFVAAASFTNKSVLSNVEPLNDILQGNGSALKRWGANFGNALLPMSGFRNEIGRVMNPALKEIKDDLGDAIRNRNNFLDIVDPQGALPEKYNFITGKKVGYPENFFVRAWNAYSPMKRHDDLTPEEQFLVDIEFNVNPQTNMSSGGVELTNTERSEIWSKMGELGTFKKELQKIMRYSNKLEHNGTKGYINILKEIRRGGLSNEAIETESFERIYPMIRTAYNKAKKQAEALLPEEMRTEIKVREYEARVKKEFSEKGQVDKSTEMAYPKYILPNR